MIWVAVIVGVLIVAIGGYLAKIVFNEKKYKDKKEIEGKEARILTRYSFKKGEWEIKNKIVLPVQSCFEFRDEEKKKLFFSSPKHKTRSFGHGLIVGGSGRGKTSKLVEPMLYFNGLIEGDDNKPSMIIPDSSSSSKESLFRKYAGWLKANGYQIKVLNLVDSEKISDIKQEQVIGSDFWNPLRVIYEIREFEDKLIKEIELLVAVLMPEVREKDSHWTNAAANIISGTIVYMLESEKYDQDSFNVINLNALLKQNFIGVMEALRDKAKYRLANDYMRLHIESYLTSAKGTLSKELASILSTINTLVQFFKRPLLQVLTAKSTFEFEDVEKKPTAIFIKADFDKADKAIMQYINLFISQIGTYWMNDTEKRDLINIIDEFNSFPKIDKLSYFLERGRKHKLWFFLFVQSLSGIELLYDDVGVFVSNFYIKIFLGSENPKDIELLLKGYELEEKAVSYSHSNSGHYGTNTSEKVKEILLGNDIKTLSGGECYVILRGVEPLKSWLDPIDKLKLKLDSDEEMVENVYHPSKVIEIKLNQKEVSETIKANKPKSKKDYRDEFDLMKKQLVKAFKLIYQGVEFAEFKTSFIDKLDFELFQDEKVGRFKVWEVIFNKAIEFEKHDKYEMVLEILGENAPEEVEIWFKKEV